MGILAWLSMSKEERKTAREKRKKRNQANVSYSLDQEIQSLGQQIADALPDEWKSSSNGVFNQDASVSVPYGNFGLINLSATITPKQGTFECYVRAVCLPLASEATEIVSSLDEAKNKALIMMITQGVAISMIFANMG